MIGALKSLGDLALIGGKRFGDAIALRFGERDLTYVELADRVGRLASALRAIEGIETGDRVAVIAVDGLETVEAYLACGAAGLVSVVVNAQLSTPEIDHILRDSGAKIVIAPRSHVEPVRRCEAYGQLVCLLETGADYQGLLADHEPLRHSFPVDPTDVAMIAYTSGTTGSPKGAMVSHAGVLTTARLVGPVAYRIPHFGRAVFSASLSFAATVWCYVFPHLAVGGSVRILGRVSIAEWVSRLRQDQATFTYVPSPLLREFAEELAKKPEILEHLETINHGGSAVPPEELEALFNVAGNRFCESWGMTEATGVITMMTRGDYRPGLVRNAFSSVGRPLPNVKITAIDQGGEALPHGEVGELLIEAENLFVGYWGQPDKTAEVMMGRAYRSGDLGYVDAGGYVFLTGRTRELIISGGINVYPVEIEQVLLGMPGVRECAVVGTPSKRWGEAVTAVIVAGDKSVSVKDVLAFCEGKLASYKRPKRVIFMDSLPRSTSLKVQKFRLVEKLEGHAWSDGDTVT